jgi:hypothetical protein
LVDAVVSIITRHPLREEELVEALERWSPGEVSETLNELQSSGRAQVVKRFGTRFWSAAPARYPDEAQSLRAMPGCRRMSKKDDLCEQV